MNTINENRSRRRAHLRFTLAVLIAAIAVSGLTGATASHAVPLAGPLAQGAGMICAVGDADVCASVVTALGSARTCAARSDDRTAKVCERAALADGTASSSAAMQKTARLHP